MTTKTTKGQYCKVFYTKQIDNYNVSIDGRNMFESPITHSLDRRGYENLRDIMIGNGDDYTVGSMIDYRLF